MNDERSYPGVLIAFEGPERGPRPAALEAVRNLLEAHGREVLVTRWMGSALAGEVYREAAPLYELSPRTLTLLAACDLAERIEWEILPAMEAGAIVLADRYLYRLVLGAARDVDPDWLETLCGVGPVPDLVLHFPVPLTELMARIEPAQLDLYEAGMDLGMSRDLPLSYRLYQERLLEGYADWSERHGMMLEDLSSIDAAVERVERLLALDTASTNHRRLAVLELLASAGANANHARQVARLARRLFELTASRHQLESPDLELLDYACLLHDIAGSELGEERPYRSARQVRDSGLAGFSQDELSAVAILIAIHRAHDEASEVEGWFQSLPAELQRKVGLLGPLLRLADGLDVGRRQTTRGVEATIHDGLFDLVLRAKDKAKLEVKAAVERADLFEQAFGLHLAIDVKRKGAPPSGTFRALAARPAERSG
jgi:dTMP kinase